MHSCIDFASGRTTAGPPDQKQCIHERVDLACLLWLLFLVIVIVCYCYSCLLFRNTLNVFSSLGSNTSEKKQFRSQRRVWELQERQKNTLSLKVEMDYREPAFDQVRMVKMV